jgi:hypothetical protein
MNRKHIIRVTTAVLLPQTPRSVPFVVARPSQTPQISGTVTDPSGAVIPGAQVAATQTNANAVRTTVGAPWIALNL